MTISPHIKISPLQQLSSICDDTFSLQAKIGSATLCKNHCSQLCGKILLSLEYLQFFTPLLLSALVFQNIQETSLAKGVFLIAKLINPGYWISFEKMDNLAIITLTIVFAIIASKILLFAWIAYKFAHNSQPHTILPKIWRIIFKFQGRILTFYMTSFLVNALTVPHIQEDQGKGNQTLAFKIISIIAITLEFSFSLGLSILYKYILPTKSFLSAKDNNMEIITLIQKFILQLLTIFLTSNAQSTPWIFATINIIMDRLRNIYFLKTLPLYNFQALLWQSYLLTLVSSFNISYFVLCIVNSVDQTHSSLLFLLSTWLIIFLLNLKLVQENWHKAFWRIITDPSIASPELLIHRISAIKQLSCMTEEFTEWNNDYQWTLLLSETLDKNLSSILKTDPANLNLSTRSKQESKLLFKNYLEKLLELNPKNQFIKLYAAKFFAKKLNIYGEPLKITKTLRKDGSRSTALLAEYVLMEIQAQIKKCAYEQSQQNKLDPYVYIQEQTLLAQLKIKILNQADLQIKIYKELKKETPDLAFLVNNSQQIKTWRDKISTKINSITQRTSVYNPHPSLLFAQYHLVLNHSIIEYLNFTHIHTTRLQKQLKAFETETLDHKNMFQDNICFYVMSGQKSDVGTVTLALKTQLPGAEASNILPGDRLHEKAAPSLRNFYQKFYQNLADNTNSPVFNKIMREFVYGEDGSLTEVDFIFSIHPHVTQGFYFTLLFRIVDSTRDAFYVTENGDIDGATKNIREKLNFPDRRQGGRLVNLADISEELAVVNHAFNMIAFPEKFKDQGNNETFLTQEEAFEIYDAYSQEGQTVLLKPLNHYQDYLQYKCRIENKIVGENTVVKTFIFEQSTKHKKLNDQTDQYLTQPISPLLIRKGKSPFSKTVPFTRDSDESTIADEKDQGWIDFNPLASFTKRDSHDTQRTETARNLLDSSRAQHKKPRKISEFITSSKYSPPIPKKRISVFPKESPRNLQQNEQNPPDASLTESLSSNLSQRKKLSNTLKKSLDTPYTSKLSKILIFLFYLTLITLVTTQLALFFSIKTNTKQLKVKKDFLRNFQYRNFLTSTIGGTIKTIYEADNGSLDPTRIIYLAGGSQGYKYLGQLLLAELSKTNKYIILNAKDIEKSVYSLLFDENIPIYNTYFDEPIQSYQNLSTLQAIDQIIETGLAFIYSENTTNPEATQKAKFMTRNTVNDLIVQNQYIADLLNDFFIQQREKIEDIIDLYRYILPSVFLAMTFFFGFFLWKQYLQEKKNLLALCQLPNKQIDSVLQNCIKFKREIEEDQRSFMENSSTFNPKGGKTTGKRRMDKTPNLQGIKRKYYVYFNKLLLVISLLIILVIASSINAKNIIGNFKTEQEQISFVDFMKARTVLSFQAYGELFISNNLALVENRPALIELERLLDEIKTAKSEIYSVLLTSEVIDSQPDIVKYLLGEACDLVDQTLLYAQCTVLKAAGKKTGMVYLLAELEEIMREKVRLYESSDKSMENLMEIVISDYNVLSGIYQVLLSAQDGVGKLVNNQLDVVIDQSKQVRIDILAIYFAVGIVVGLGTWVFLLRKLKAGVSEFKNLLRIFPAEVVFSSFLLKNFLKKTSERMIEEYVKN